MGNTWVVSCPMRWPTLRRLRIRCARAGRARARGRRRRDEGVCLSERAILPVRVSVWLFTGKSFHFDTEDT